MWDVNGCDHPIKEAVNFTNFVGENQQKLLIEAENSL